LTRSLATLSGPTSAQGPEFQTTWVVPRSPKQAGTGVSPSNGCYRPCHLSAGSEGDRPPAGVSFNVCKLPAGDPVAHSFLGKFRARPCSSPDAVGRGGGASKLLLMWKTKEFCRWRPWPSRKLKKETGMDRNTILKVPLIAPPLQKLPEEVAMSNADLKHLRLIRIPGAGSRPSHDGGLVRPA